MLEFVDAQVNSAQYYTKSCREIIYMMLSERLILGPAEDLHQNSP